MPVVSDFAFEIKPIAVRQQYAKSYDLPGQYLAHSVEVAAAFGEIGDLRRMSFFATMPLCIEMNA